MKMKKQFILLFVVAFIFSIILTLVGMWPMGRFDTQNASLYVISGSVSTVISPFLAFFAFYFIARDSVYEQIS